MENASLPLQHREGTVNFFGYELRVTPDVLIPRPETEILVETALSLIRTHGRFGARPEILDLGTGSGNIAISLTKALKESRIVASDISVRALEAAAYNAASHGVSDRIEFIESDLFENIRVTFDMIVSNPPYVAREEFFELPPEVLEDPVIALDGGAGGLAVIRAIVEKAPAFVKPGGWVLMEIGYDQSDAVSRLIGSSQDLRLVEIRKDYAGIERVVVAQKNG